MKALAWLIGIAMVLGVAVWFYIQYTQQNANLLSQAGLKGLFGGISGLIGKGGLTGLFSGSGSSVDTGGDGTDTGEGTYDSTELAGLAPEDSSEMA